MKQITFIVNYIVLYLEFVYSVSVVSHSDQVKQLSLVSAIFSVSFTLTLTLDPSLNVYSSESPSPVSQYCLAMFTQAQKTTNKDHTGFGRLFHQMGHLNQRCYSRNR